MTEAHTCAVLFTQKQSSDKKALSDFYHRPFLPTLSLTPPLLMLLLPSPPPSTLSSFSLMYAIVSWWIKSVSYFVCTQTLCIVSSLFSVSLFFRLYFLLYFFCCFRLLSLFVFIVRQFIWGLYQLNSGDDETVTTIVKIQIVCRYERLSAASAAAIAAAFDFCPDTKYI